VHDRPPTHIGHTAAIRSNSRPLWTHVGRTPPTRPTHDALIGSDFASGPGPGQHFNGGRSTPHSGEVCPDLPRADRPPCVAGHSTHIRPYRRDPIKQPSTVDARRSNPPTRPTHDALIGSDFASSPGPGQHFNGGRSTPHSGEVCPDLPRADRPPCMADHPRTSAAIRSNSRPLWMHTNGRTHTAPGTNAGQPRRRRSAHQHSPETSAKSAAQDGVVDGPQTHMCADRPGFRRRPIVGATTSTVVDPPRTTAKFAPICRDRIDHRL
jgi:hypothetical protein